MSPRYFSVLSYCLALALIPTVLHTYAGTLREDGLRTRAIPETLAGLSSIPTDRKADWGSRRFGSDDWIERVYGHGAQRVRLTVVRSYDAKAIYHHPELAIVNAASFTPAAAIEWLPAHGDVPVHVLRPAKGGTAVALFALHWDGRFVKNPIAYQMRMALRLLFTPRSPMTLFFVTETHSEREITIDRLASAAVLSAAIDAFFAQSNGSTAAE